MARRRTDASLAALALALLPAYGAARAEPYISLRSGLQCPSCHVNQTGGGKRNDYGVGYGLRMLPAHDFPLPAGTEPFDGTISPNLLVGADYRGGNEGRFAPSGDTDTFATLEGNLYVEMRLLPDRLRLYGDVSVAPGTARSRELFVLLSHLPGRIYVKAGRFLPPYGWRLQDDDAFIRSRTGYTFRSPDDGVELGWQPGDFLSSVAVTNGNGGATDDNTNKRVSMTTAWSRPRFRLGGSFASNRQGEVSSLLGGVMAGVKLGPRVVALGEVDVGRSDDGVSEATTRSRVAYGEVDVLVGKGMNLKAAFDFEDPDTARSGDEVNRITFGAEYFVTQYVQVRLLWRRTDRPPFVDQVAFEDDREIVAELHLFL